MTKEGYQPIKTKKTTKIIPPNTGSHIRKEKRIAELEQENAELERKLEQTEKDLADYQFNYPTIKELQKENAELKAQIEKMKCCYNCSKWNEGLLLCNDSSVRVTTYADYCCEDWEIKEND